MENRRYAGVYSSEPFCWSWLPCDPVEVSLVGLSLKKKWNLRNKLTSNPTELWFKGLGKYPNMLYLMSLGNLRYI